MFRIERVQLHQNSWRKLPTGDDFSREKKFTSRSSKRVLLYWAFFLLGIKAWSVPVASFTSTQTTGCAPLAVQFTNTSAGATSYYWDLGNGSTSTLADPANIYTSSGSFTITLIATDSIGNTDTTTVVNYIVVAGKPSASFTAPVTTACLDNNLVSFSNNSVGAVSYTWDFGDGTISTDSGPAHSYSQAGTFTVSLIATNANGCTDQNVISNYITVYPDPLAGIQVNKILGCSPADTFYFSSTSLNAVSWSWSFGDGSAASSSNPAHVYTSPSGGIYNVSLVVTDNHGCLDSTEINTSIQVYPQSWADFTTANQTGCAPLTCLFTGATFDSASYSWNFGDGSTGTGSALSHIYNTSGIYTVNLSISLSNGCSDTVTKVNYVTVNSRPVVNFTASSATGCNPYTVTFTNQSLNFISCTWNFGDGTTSSVTHPVHTYTSAGSFTVVLTCTTATGCTRTLTKNNFIAVAAPTVAFSATPRNGCPPMMVTFTNNSIGNQLSYLWDFGDGTTSALANPAHLYASQGNYDVTLTITDSSGCNAVLIKIAYIKITDLSSVYVPPPTATGCAPYTASFSDVTPGAVSWLWDFGDGNTSTVQNPVHTYTQGGFYTVTLTTQTAGGGCVQTINNYSTFDIEGGAAAFSATYDPCPPFDVTFHDSSQSAIAWVWNFGDGTVSNLQHPTHVYADPGYHTVSLTVTTAAGCTYNIMQSNGIYFAPFAAAFYSIPRSSTFPMIIDFYANSIGATGWLWDFGDTTFSALENPSHLYADSGTYNVTLTITNGPCTLFYDPPPIVFVPPDTSLILPPSSGSPPIPQKGCAPFNVSFAYQVPGAVSWHWDFGDGDSSSLEYPSHTYLSEGQFTVNLLVTDSLGVQSTQTFDSCVWVSGPQASFTFTQFQQCSNTLVNFNNTSSGALHSWWDFGDGTYDSTMNPVHIYTSGLSNYIITLKITDGFGCQSAVSSSMFINTSNPVAISETDICGNDTVYFSSTKNYASYLWNFGDGTTDTLPSSQHVYLSQGVYFPSLTVTDQGGCTQTFNSTYPINVSLPQADFTAPGTRNCDILRVDFQNMSTNADTYVWNFGDGSTSALFQPSHIYNKGGAYTVTLTVYKNGCYHTLQKTNFVIIDTARAAFSYTLGTNCQPFNVSFTDQSTNAVSWKWDFGDYHSSTLQNPSHLYDSIAPVKNIVLTIVDINGCIDSISVPKFSEPEANFSVDRSSGCLPLTVHFFDSVLFASSMLWDFGDGTTSASPNPSHTYSTPGNYQVKLIAYSLPQFGSCSDTFYLPVSIQVIRPTADFNATGLSACAPSLVAFNNLSLGGDSYSWDFGDGSSSTNINPSHIYNQPGTYTITLVTTTTEGCSDTLVRTAYVQVRGPQTSFSLSDSIGCAPFHVQFTDLSGNAVSWLWNFGDGYSSSSPSPSHTYSDTGTFTVALLTSDSTGCSSFYQYPVPVEVHAPVAAAFTTVDTAGCGSLMSSFTNLSVAFDNVSWNFGDGASSTVVNPQHTYVSPGQYTVTLIASSIYGCSDTATFTDAVTVHQVPNASFTSNVTQGCPPLAVIFQNLSTDTVNPSYSWNLGNGQASQAMHVLELYTSPGLYTVTLSVINSTGCSDSITMASYIHVFDTIPPPVSEILCVSVVSDTSVEIIWENNPEIDLGEYVLRRYNPVLGLYEIIYTDTNPNNSSFALTSRYVDTGLNTLDNTYTYKLETFDVCGYSVGMNYLREHTSINLEAQAMVSCNRINWNAYGGCAVDSYEIFRAFENDAFIFIASVPGDTLTYADSSFLCPGRYSYKVVGTNLCFNPYSSHSDTSASYVANMLTDQKVNIIRSSVVDNEFIYTEWIPPLVKPQSVVQYDIYRSTDSVHYFYLATVPSPQTNFSDYDASIQSSRYYYRVLVINSCDITQGLSNEGTSILLNGDMSDDRIIHLKWTPYDKWDFGVDHYLIERKDENGQWQMIKKINGTVLSVDLKD